MTREIELNVNGKASADAGIFGLPADRSKAKVIYEPIPFDATTSYADGTHLGPMAILNASSQIDLFSLVAENPHAVGLFYNKEKTPILNLNKKARLQALKVIADRPLKNSLKIINDISHQVNEIVYQKTVKNLAENKISVVVGGDHSTPYGAIRAYSEKFKKMSVLHFDAHHDLRHAYLGMTHSHASIMYNVLPLIHSLTQVGIRDFCEEEYNLAKTTKKISVFYDQHMQKELLSGVVWNSIATKIVSTLPHDIYISFDIDGLEPSLCPSTGTPVMGGLNFGQVEAIFREIIKQKKKIIGFDLVEVAPNLKLKNEWDANVGMRLLYTMTTYTLLSQGLIRERI